MTQIQEQVLDECRQKLGEHFQSYLVAALWDDTTLQDEALQEGKVIYHGGGWVAAIGLAEYAKWMLLERTVRKPLPPQEGA